MTETKFVVEKLSILEQMAPVAMMINNEHVLIAKINGDWLAYSLRCPHKGATMRKDDLHGSELACPLHGWIFDLTDSGREVHGYVDLPEYKVDIENDTLFIDFS